MSHTVTVTQDDIDYGTVTQDACPIALATKRALGIDSITVESSGCILTDNDTLPANHWHASPIDTNDIDIEQWIAAFDNKQPVQPFSFELYADEPNE